MTPHLNFNTNIIEAKDQFFNFIFTGAHEPQTTSLEKITEAQHRLESQNDENKEVKEMFEHMRDILVDTSENVQMAKIGQNMAREETVRKKVKIPSVKYLSAEDRKIIVDGSYHSMKKFDSAENYGREPYIALLTAEVRRHFVEEKNIQDEFTESDNVIKFINATIRRITKELSFN